MDVVVVVGRRSPITEYQLSGATTAVISMWISNTAATAMMLPIGLGILGAIPRRRAGRALSNRPDADALLRLDAVA